MLNKFVVFHQSVMGSNTHHYFDTYAEAEKYCNKGYTSGWVIGFVLAAQPPLTLQTVSPQIIDYLGKLPKAKP